MFSDIIKTMRHEKNNVMEDPIKVIYMFRVNGEGDEIGEPIPLRILPGGSVDISQVSSALRKTWETMGIRTLGGFNAVRPNDGETFLLALLQSTNGYSRFRRSPKRL